MRGLIVALVVFILLQGNLGLEMEQETETHVITVDSTNLRFTPSSITIKEGDTLRFVWGGQALPHNSVEENGVFDSGDPERDLDYGHVFDYDSAGTYGFFCEPHQAVVMTGSVTVQDVDQPTQEENGINSSTSETNDSSNGFQIGIVIGFVALFGAAMWRARIYD